jgi:hypothetical protein
MRPKVVIAILLLAAGLLGVIALASKALRLQSTTSADSGQVPPAAAASSNPVKAPLSNPQPVVSVAPTPTVTNALPATDTNAAAAHAQYVRQRIEELNDLAMNNDVQSRDTILSELKSNPDKKIRAAALEAAIQFDDRSVVPPMQEIAAQTEDPDEKAVILEAIDYINLPSINEFIAANPNSTPGSAQGSFPSHTHTHTQSPNSGQ